MVVVGDDDNNRLRNSETTIRRRRTITTATTITTDRYDIYDTINENFNRALNEIAKFQPQYLQSISNLQLDCIQTAKNMMQNIISVQKQMAENNNSRNSIIIVNNSNNNNSSSSSSNIWNIPLPLSIPIPYIEQFTRQLTDFTTNTIRISNLNNQFTITILDALRENLNIYNRATDELTKYNTNIAKAWNSFFLHSNNSI
jgi:hypothetical protein